MSVPHITRSPVTCRKWVMENSSLYRAMTGLPNNETLEHFPLSSSKLPREGFLHLPSLLGSPSIIPIFLSIEHSKAKRQLHRFQLATPTSLGVRRICSLVTKTCRCLFQQLLFAVGSAGHWQQRGCSNTRTFAWLCGWIHVPAYLKLVAANSLWHWWERWLTADMGRSSRDSFVICRFLYGKTVSSLRL